MVGAMTEQTFIKINAVVGRADDKPITIQEQDEFNDSFIEWLEAAGYETCAILELVTGELEDLQDAQAAREALQAHEAGETVPWDDVRCNLWIPSHD